jgi:adenylate kinase
VNIVLFGPPGAGKGTQADNLVKEFKLLKISSGDLLRKEIKKKSVLGLKIKPTIDNGEFVSDEIINNLIENMVSNKESSNRLIFDGYPRNLNQAINLDSTLAKYNQKISCVLSLKVDKDLIIKRLSGRQVCSKCGLTLNKYFKKQSSHACDPKYLETRSDDNEKTINNRFETYTKETLPVINYYLKQKLVKDVDGMVQIDEIYKKIRLIIDSLET